MFVDLKLFEHGKINSAQNIRRQNAKSGIAVSEVGCGYECSGVKPPFERRIGRCSIGNPVRALTTHTSVGNVARKSDRKGDATAKDKDSLHLPSANHSVGEAIYVGGNVLSASER